MGCCCTEVIVSFLSARQDEMLSPSNVALLMFLLGNFLKFIFVEPAGANDRSGAAHAILLLSSLVSIALVELGVYAFPKAATPAVAAAPIDHFIGALNGVLAVAAGAIASTLTAAASGKVRASAGLAPRSAPGARSKPLISAWL